MVVEKMEKLAELGQKQHFHQRNLCNFFVPWRAIMWYKTFLPQIEYIFTKKCLVIALEGTKKLQRFLWWKCWFLASFSLVFVKWHHYTCHFLDFFGCKICSYIQGVPTKKNHEKISTQSKAVVDWIGTVFSLKMTLFFLATQLCSPICGTSIWPKAPIFTFWGPQTCYRVY